MTFMNRLRSPRGRSGAREGSRDTLATARLSEFGSEVTANVRLLERTSSWTWHSDTMTLKTIRDRLLHDVSLGR